MRALVLGGCGFIGSHVVDQLIAQGHNVVVFDRQAERFRSPLPGVDYLLGDFTDRMAIVEALTGVDTVFHLISTTFPGTADLDPKTDVQDNLVGTLQLLELMQGSGTSRLVFLSSGGTVYGKPDEVPVQESHPLRPISSYGIVKSTIELYLEFFRRKNTISPIILRASNPYGPRQGHASVQGVVSTFLTKIAKGENIEVWGDGSIVRDFIDVRDLAELCGLAAVSRHEGAYNAGSGAGHSLNDLIQALRKTTGRNFEVIRKPRRVTDVPVSILDCSKAQRDFGWSARYSLEDGLEDLWAWIRETYKIP